MNSNVTEYAERLKYTQRDMGEKGFNTQYYFGKCFMLKIYPRQLKTPMYMDMVGMKWKMKDQDECAQVDSQYSVC